MTIELFGDAVFLRAQLAHFFASHIVVERSSVNFQDIAPRSLGGGSSNREEFKVRPMKKDIHPQYREVVFLDMSTGEKFVTRSTIKTEKTGEYEGRQLPLVTVDISSLSHPFFTGKQKFIDTAGRVEKFQKKYNWDKREKK